MVTKSSLVQSGRTLEHLGMKWSTNRVHLTYITILIHDTLIHHGIPEGSVVDGYLQKVLSIMLTGRCGS